MPHGVDTNCTLEPGKASALFPAVHLLTSTRLAHKDPPACVCVSNSPRLLIDRVHLLLRHGVIPYLVFDGGYLPAKAGKEKERRTKREANLHRGMQLLREGDSAGAQLFFCKAADVTPFMAYQLIQVTRGTLVYCCEGTDTRFWCYSPPFFVLFDSSLLPLW